MSDWRDNRIAELEQQLRELKQAFAPRLLFPFEWLLTAAEHDYLSCLYTSPTGFRTNLQLKTCAETARSLRDSKRRKDTFEIVGVTIFKIRKKLRPYGITIINDPGEGYILPTASKKIIKAALIKEGDPCTSDSQ